MKEGARGETETPSGQSEEKTGGSMRLLSPSAVFLVFLGCGRRGGRRRQRARAPSRLLFFGGHSAPAQSSCDGRCVACEWVASGMHNGWAAAFASGQGGTPASLRVRARQGSSDCSSYRLWCVESSPAGAVVRARGRHSFVLRPKVSPPPCGSGLLRDCAASRDRVPAHGRSRGHAGRAVFQAKRTSDDGHVRRRQRAGRAC